MTTAKPLKYFCSCGRGFTSRSGEANHNRACPIEQDRSARFVEWLESGCVGPRPVARTMEVAR